VLQHCPIKGSCFDKISSLGFDYGKNVGIKGEIGNVRCRGNLGGKNWLKLKEQARFSCITALSYHGITFGQNFRFRFDNEKKGKLLS
jgi:hypothetical protein